VRADPAQTSQSRSVGAFRAIELAGTLEVEVAIGRPVSVEVSGEADLVDKVTTQVKDGVLVLDTKEIRRHNRRSSHLRAVITAPDLSALSISGTGEMKITGIASDKFAIDLSGTGAVTASGSVGALRVDVAGTGEVAGRQLAAKDLAVDISGTGSARLHATRSVEARITGTGSLHVDGHPASVKKQVSGLGSIKID
jgi:hypothetical protein